MTHSTIYDVIIVGGGPAGCSAALLLARSCRKVLLIDAGNHRNRQSQGIHNYLTRDGIHPRDFHLHTQKELAAYKVEIVKGLAVSAKKLTDKGFEIKDENNNEYLGRRLLIATGVKDEIPAIPGMQELWGKSIFHCPFCDGWECKDGTIVLYAPRQNGFGMALALKHLCTSVTLLTDGAYYLSPRQRQQLAAVHINVISKRVKMLEVNNGRLEGVLLTNGNLVRCDSIFVLHRHHVNDELLKQLTCRCTKLGAAITNRHQQTSVPGLYVAGDASFDMHMVILAAAEGAKAGVAIHNDLLKTDNLI